MPLYKPYNYQIYAKNHILNHPKCGIWMDMGLGKTAVTLSAINEILYYECEVDISKVLVIATKRITRGVWKQEAEKWEHLKNLKVAIVWGTVQQRIAALKSGADVFIINRENIVWLVQLFQGKWPFQMVVLDESSSFKSHQSQRFKALKMILPKIVRLVELTGTPAPNGLMDLWAQMYLLDQGQRLEKTITGYRERYFTLKNPGELFSGYRLRAGSEKTIYEKVNDICISMKGKDYTDLPPIIENDIFLTLDPKVKAQYDQFEEDNIMRIANKDITALNAAALNTKLMQFANGAVYDAERGVHELHNEKLDALEEIIEEAEGQSIFAAYAYQHDLSRIRKRFSYARMLNNPKDEEDWNNGRIKLLVGHPASMGHGLNLQFGGHIVVWFGLTWNLEHYQQTPARLQRPGQSERVIMHRLITLGTIDEDAAIALKKKGDMQEALLEAVKVRMNKYTHR